MDQPPPSSPPKLKAPIVIGLSVAVVASIIAFFSNTNSSAKQEAQKLTAQITSLQEANKEQASKLDQVALELEEEQHKLITVEELQQSQLSDLQSQLDSTTAELKLAKETALQATTNLDRLKREQETTKGPIGDSTITPTTALNESTLPLQQALDASQAVFSLHWEAHSPVFEDLNRPKYEQAITLWQNLATQLADHPSLSKETARLQLSIAQAQLSRDTLPDLQLESIPWEAAGLSELRPEIQTRLWFTAATIANKQKNPTKAQSYLKLCTAALEREKADPSAPHRKDYISAMVELLNAQLAEQTRPHKALEHYLAATKHLEAVTASQPSLVHLRTSLARSYIDSSLHSEGRNRLTEMNQLLRLASQEITKLTKKDPKLALPHKLQAEIALIQAQNQVTLGEKQSVLKSLNTLDEALSKAGGDTLIEAGSAGVRAFQLWETGKITAAVKLMDDAVASIQALSKEDPTNTEILYRLAIALWERSAMRVSINDGLKDSTEASKLLVKIINQGAGKREASVRRTLAILYGDIGHIAAESNQDKIAKQYFQQSLKHWQFLHDNWDSGSEYSEGLRWCKQKIKSL